MKDYECNFKIIQKYQRIRILHFTKSTNHERFNMINQTQQTDGEFQIKSDVKIQQPEKPYWMNYQNITTNSKSSIRNWNKFWYSYNNHRNQMK